MSWRDELQTLGRASFRGVEFKVRQVEDGGIGRRVAILEAPGRDKPGHEDLGRSTEDISFDAYFIGDDYLDELKAMREALRKAGPGELVHPYFGVRQVLLRDPASITHVTRERGYAVVHLRFVEVGDDYQALALPDTASGILRAADKVDAALVNQVASRLSVVGQPQYYRNAVRDTVYRGLDALRSANSYISSALAQIDEASTVIDRYGDQIADLIDTPRTIATALLELGATVMGQAAKVEAAVDALLSSGQAVVQTVLDAARAKDASVVGRRAATATKAMDGVLDWGDDEETFDTETPQREQAGLNVRTMVTAVHVATITGCARALTELLPESHGQAIVIRDDIFVRIDDQAAELDDELYQALQDLGVAVSEHLTSVASSLPRITTWTTAANSNALVIAHQVHGDATRVDEIAVRNGLSHPGFVPGGTALEVVADAA